MARASGSYPAGRKFKSHYRYQDKISSSNSLESIWPGGQAVKTPPFHGGNTSSILVRVTKIRSILLDAFLFSMNKENQKDRFAIGKLR